MPKKMIQEEFETNIICNFRYTEKVQEKESYFYKPKSDL